MQKAIIGKKIGMTQIFDEKGRVVPVTVIEAGPCVVTQKKTVENDGYACSSGWLRRSESHSKVNKAHDGPFRQGRRSPEENPERIPICRLQTLTT